ncbi:EF-hand domain-containing family member B isoform X2 [Monodelphis domestica]|uniref:EF-hand domain-containing family member B isoform X2 n=1 Tax=Monodelphis domestica TaxID=13616 RepID=UPI0004432ACC|nr:EF-hand domain-containing family member B isoform X2 [Monodelphis domestica]
MDSEVASGPSPGMGTSRTAEFSEVSELLKTIPGLRARPCLEKYSVLGLRSSPRRRPVNLVPPPGSEPRFEPSLRSSSGSEGRLVCIENEGTPGMMVRPAEMPCPEATSLLKDMSPTETNPDLGMKPGLGLETHPPSAMDIRDKDPENRQKMQEKLAMHISYSPKTNERSIRELSEEIFSPGPTLEVETEPSCQLEVGLPSRVMPKLEPAIEGPVGLVIEPPGYDYNLKPEELPKPEKCLEPGVEHPDNVRPIYLGKYFDRTPCWRSAGKIIPIGYRVGTCLTEKWPPPVTPPNERKFYKARYPEPGTRRVFYGRANDPDVSHLKHGKQSEKSIRAGPVINPPPLSIFQQTIKDKKESLYLSNRRAPLGKSHDQMQNLPECIDIYGTTFGVPIFREITAREIVNPPKSFEQVQEEAARGHDLYVVSHNDYQVGEVKNRNYNPASFHKLKTFGVETPHTNNGRSLAKSLCWLHELQMKKGSKIISKRVNDFKEKHQHQLGKPWDPIAETMTVPPDHTFGILLEPEDYGAADLIYNRLPSEYRRGKDREWAVLSAVRQQLKKVNYHNFDSLLLAFRHFDRNGDGFIDKPEFQRACFQMNLQLDQMLLDELFDYCDLDEDGRINYLEFTNFLNWKGKMPIQEFEEKILKKGKKVSENPPCLTIATGGDKSNPLINPEDIVKEEPGSEMKSPHTLSRPTDKVFADYKTSSSQINSVVGGISPMCIPMCGVPTIRSDICAPRFRRISDRNNYGDSGDAYSLLYPSVFSEKGVFERDFFKARSKDEVACKEEPRQWGGNRNLLNLLPIEYYKGSQKGRNQNQRLKGLINWMRR